VHRLVSEGSSVAIPGFFFTHGRHTSRKDYDHDSTLKDRGALPARYR
jgi:hypothetical protein